MDNSNHMIVYVIVFIFLVPAIPHSQHSSTVMLQPGPHIHEEGPPTPMSEPITVITSGAVHVGPTTIIPGRQQK